MLILLPFHSLNRDAEHCCDLCSVISSHDSCNGMSQLTVLTSHIYATHRSNYYSSDTNTALRLLMYYTFLYTGTDHV